MTIESRSTKTRWSPAARAIVAVAAALSLALVIAFVVRAGDRRTDRRLLEGRLASGEQFADSLERTIAALPAESIRTSDAVAALYLERLRLGLGSPFRIIELSQRDPLLPDTVRRLLGYALLARIRVGDSYHTEPRALDLVNDEVAKTLQVGERHAELIDSLVAGSRDPRTGELTVRLAYRLAMAAGTVARRAPEVATHAASQARDRILSIDDAQQLLHTAVSNDLDPLTLVPGWRAARRFSVERPTMTPLSGRSERAAVQAIPAALKRIASINSLGQATTSKDAAEQAPHVYGEGLARRMAGLAELRGGPPQAPVTITVAGYSPLIGKAAGASDREQSLRSRFVARARNEETLTAEYVLLRARTRSSIAPAAVAVLTSGVALRPYAQEEGWLPGDVAPTTRELMTRFGFASVTFDTNVPASWRPYFRRMLAIAVTDFKRVFPTYNPSGLRVRFGESPLKERALALHDPVSRTVYLPITSSAGVIAHELAHDLDWQAARTSYGLTVGYRTDLAVRQQSDWLAGALRRMASAPRMETRGGPLSQERPTEVFARNVDWFVSAMLAREGRMNGYLSAVQDPVLSGYASATTPEVAHDAGEATLHALDGITYVEGPGRHWFDELFGAGRKVSAHEAVRRVLEAPLAHNDYRRTDSGVFTVSDEWGTVLRTVPVLAEAWSCVVGTYALRGVDRDAISAVMQHAAEARAEGIVRRWAKLAMTFGSQGPVRLRALDGAPWNPAIADELKRELRDAILWRSMRVGASRTPLLDGSLVVDCTSGD